MFNLFVSLYKFLKSHSSLLLVDSYTGCGSWLLLLDSYNPMYTLVVAHVIHVFLIPVITQHSTYKISPSESSAPSCLPYNIDVAFGQFFAFQYHMANCLITFSAILQFAGTFCLSVVFIVLDLKAWSCAAIIISSISIFSQLPFFSVMPKSLYLLLLFLQNCP